MNAEDKLINEKTEGVGFETHYSGLGWFLYTVIGMSAKPTRVDFVNEKTGEILRSTKDPEELKKYVGR